MDPKQVFHPSNTKIQFRTQRASYDLDSETTAKGSNTTSQKSISDPIAAPNKFGPCEKSDYERFLVSHQAEINHNLRTKTPIHCHQASLKLVGREFSGKSHFQKVTTTRRRPEKPESLYDVPTLRHVFISNRNNVIRDVTEQMISMWTREVSVDPVGHALAIGSPYSSNYSESESMSYKTSLVEEFSSFANLDRSSDILDLLHSDKYNESFETSISPSLSKRPPLLPQPLPIEKIALGAKYAKSHKPVMFQL